MQITNALNFSTTSTLNGSTSEGLVITNNATIQGSFFVPNFRLRSGTLNLATGSSGSIFS